MHGRNRLIAPWLALLVPLLTSGVAQGQASLDFTAPLHWAKLAESEEGLRQVAFSAPWLKLLHYRRTWAGGWRSDADTPQFFLSEAGRDDPLVELRATLSAMSSAQTTTPAAPLPAPCVFPARFAFVKDAFPGRRFTDVACPDFESWRDRLAVDSVTLVFASAYANNPASMFGHTLLRLNRRREDAHRDGVELLDYAVSFLARTDPDDDPLTYTYKGMTGGYLGLFNIDPYYTTVAVYTNSERRDLWEYELPLAPAQLQRLVAHLWELEKAGGFTYFFFDENCSYQILALLEAAVPEWELTSETGIIVLPLESVRQLLELMRAEKPSAPVHAVRRISLAQQYRNARQAMTPEDSASFRSVLRGTRPLSTALGPRTLDGLIAYLNLRNYKRTNKLSDDQQRLFSTVLRERARLADASTASSPVLIRADEKRPDFGHGPHALRVEAGLIDDRAFAGVRWKMGLHDLLNDDAGYEPFSSIDYFEASIMQREGDAIPRVDSLKFAEVTSLKAFDPLLPELSWHLSLVHDRIADLGCPTCRKTAATGGGGLATSAVNDMLVAYTLVLGTIEVSPDLGDAQFRAGPVWRNGLVWKPSRGAYTLQAEARLQHDWSENSPRQQFWTYSVHQAYAYARDYDVRLTGSFIPARGEFEPDREWRVLLSRYY